MSSSAIFLNPILLDRILKEYLIIRGKKGAPNSIMDHLKLRRVSRSFNSSVLHLIRQEHKEIVISPIPEDVKGFLLNNRRILMTRRSGYYTFLNSRAAIQIRSLKFEGFEKVDMNIHDVIILDLIGVNAHTSLHTFLGSTTICPCSECPFCWNLIQNPSTIHSDLPSNIQFSESKHFKTLSIYEEFLDDVENSEKSISPKVSCDLLEITVSDVRRVTVGEDKIRKPYMFSLDILNRILTTWKVKKIRLNFDGRLKASKAPQEVPSELSPFHFGQDFRTQKTSRIQNPLLESVEINLWNSETCATAFVYSMIGRYEPENGAGFQNLLPNVMRVFPTKTVMIRMPMVLKFFILSRFPQVLDGIKRFTWADPLNCRHTEFNFRLICDDYKGNVGKVKTNYQFHSRPIHLTPSKTNKTIDSWPIPKYEEPLDKLRVLSLLDQENLSRINVQILKIRGKKKRGSKRTPTV